MLKFTETSQYPEQKWLAKYVDYYISLSNRIWGQKYEGFNKYLVRAPLAVWSKDFLKTNYLEKNNATILQNISKHYTKYFTHSLIPRDWLYSEKKMTVVANSYEYLGITPEEPGFTGIRARVNLTFAYLNNPQITVTRDVELWMEYFYVQPQKDEY